LLSYAPVRRWPSERGDAVTVSVQVPLEDGKSGAVVLVEADRGDIPGGLTLASPEPGQAR
jgi:hypothetical protein